MRSKNKQLKLTYFLICCVVFISATVVSISTIKFQAFASTINFEIAKEATKQQLPQSFNNPGNYRSNFAMLVGRLIGVVMPLAALLLLLYIIWGAIEWITSGGEKGKIENARKRITNGVLGIIIVSATVSLFMLMQQILNICVLDFGGVSCENNSGATGPAVTPTSPSGGFPTIQPT